MSERLQQAVRNPEWIAHKLTDDSWAEWRTEHPEEVARLKTQERVS